MVPTCRQALLIAPLILAVALANGCRPAYERQPWTLAFQYDDTGQRLPTVLPMGGPFFYRALQPEGAAPSPTGAHMLMATQEGELWLYDVLARGEALRRLAQRGVAAQFWPDVSPWSLDGRTFVYVQDGDLFIRPLDGQPRRLTTTGDVFTAAISPDGKQVAFGRRDAQEQDQGLWRVPADGGDAQRLVSPTNDIFHACCPHWSPDGKWIAFLQAFEGGALGVVSADGLDLRAGIEAAWEPLRWLPDSKTLLFTKIVYGEPGDGVHAYNVDTKKTSLLTASGRNTTYALSPDGTRALVASWREASDGKVTDGKLQIASVTTGALEGQPAALSGSAASCHWAPDGRQFAVLVEDAQGNGSVLYGREGLAALQQMPGAASGVIGWVRLWQPRRPWWRFWG